MHNRSTPTKVACFHLIFLFAWIFSLVHKKRIYWKRGLEINEAFEKPSTGSVPGACMETHHLLAVFAANLPLHTLSLSAS
jgi:hypothetical protein